MKFPGFKEFGSSVPTLDEVFRYLRTEHTLNLKELVTGLSRLAFADNFKCFEVTVTIVAGAELAIANKLRDGDNFVIPTKRLIVRSNSETICDGDSEWTKNFVFMKNTGATDATATIIFLK